MTYGAVFLAGHELTMASIAALPVLIGLAVDYAIQLHARFDEARAEGLDAQGRGAHGGARAARRRSPARRSPPRPASWCCCSRRSRWSTASRCW